MKRMMFVVVATLFAAGCSHITGATTLTPANPEPSKGVWLFIESDSSSLTGIYRCHDAADGAPICKKANW